MFRTWKGLPLYIADFTDTTLFNCVSLVDAPAIEEMFLKFSSQEQEDKRFQFSLNEEEKIVTGPAMLPDTPIYRRYGVEEFYLEFNAETIKKFAVEFFRKGRQNTGDVDHQLSVDGVTFFESYIKNSSRNIAPKEFSALPDGTWFLSAKIENDELWQAIKNHQINGFSIDIVTPIRPEQEKEIETIEDLMDYLKNN